MLVTTDKGRAGVVCVKYIKTHTNHTPGLEEVNRLPLPSTVREEVKLSLISTCSWMLSLMVSTKVMKTGILHVCCVIAVVYVYCLYYVSICCLIIKVYKDHLLIAITETHLSWKQAGKHSSHGKMYETSFVHKEMH